MCEWTNSSVLLKEQLMKAIWSWGTVAALVLSLAAGVAAQQQTKPQTAKKPVVKQEAKEENEQAEKADAKKPAVKVELPAAVKAAFQKTYPKATIKGTAKETENGKTVYEVESVDQGLNRDLIYNADGTVVEIEEQINTADLPATVSAALKKLYPQATITKAERLTRDQAVQYEMSLKGAPKASVAFTPDGKVVGPTPPK
jgi:hypothetical protein